MQQPKVSILIPAYNAEEFIEATLESVLTQSHKNLEVIVRDDGSTDGTLVKLRRFSPTVTILGGPNIGPARGRNILFQASTGGIVHFHDSDDLLHQDFCSAIVETFHQNPACDVVLNNIEFVGEGLPVSQITYSADLLNADPVGHVLINPIHAASSNYRRAFLTQFSPLFDHKFIRAEDWELNLRIAVSGGRFAICPGILKTCLRRENSFSSESLYCALAISYMYHEYVTHLLPQKALNPKTWASSLTLKLYMLGDMMSLGGYPANAREAWKIAEELDSTYDFGNFILNHIKRFLGTPWAFLIWGLRRSPVDGPKALARYLLWSRGAPVRLGS